MPNPPYPLHESIIPRLDPEYADFYNKHIINHQQTHYQPISVSRASGIIIPGAGPPQPVAKTQDLTIPRAESSGPDVSIRCFTPLGEAPEGGWPVMLWIHGGGWVLGNIDTENVICTHLCNRAKCVAITTDYRLAPESPFPAAAEDCWETVLWVLGAGAKVLDLNTNLMAVGGSSAGGNLTAVMCMRSIERWGTSKFKLQLLSVPVMDNTADTTNNASWKENELAPALTPEKMIWYRKHYLPDQKDWKHPEASPIFWEGDWAKLPPAVFVLGELDILRSEGEQFAEKMKEAGVDTQVHIMKGQPHPFIAMDQAVREGARAITIFCDALRPAMYPQKN